MVIRSPGESVKKIYNLTQNKVKQAFELQSNDKESY